VYIRHIITVRIIWLEYLYCAAFVLSNPFTCQGKPVAGIFSVKATCHQLLHTTFSLSGLCQKTTIEGSTCALDSSVVLHRYTPCDRTVPQSMRYTECPVFSKKKKTQNKSSGRGETTKSKKQRKRKTIKTKVQRSKMIGLYQKCKTGWERNNNR
jgi:hypothetical protein